MCLLGLIARRSGPHDRLRSCSFPLLYAVIKVQDAEPLTPSRRRRAPILASAPARRRRGEDWWRCTDSNRGPPACKAGALPTELHPQLKAEGGRRTAEGAFPPCALCLQKLVGAPGLEPGTSALSGLRSNQLSYAPPLPKAEGGKQKAEPNLPPSAVRRLPGFRGPSPLNSVRTSISIRPGQEDLRPPARPRSPGVPTEGRPCGLRRKEVIQPHLPVRLPCYDLAPIADPTFTTSLPCGLGQWLRVKPTLIA